MIDSSYQANLKSRIFVEQERLANELYDEISADSRTDEQFCRKLDAIEDDEFFLGSSSQMLIHKALQYGKLQVVQKLIEKGCNLNFKDTFGSTPLHYAALNNNKEMVGLLLSHKANTSITDADGNTPFNLAIQYRSKEVISEFKQFGVQLDFQEYCSLLCDLSIDETDLKSTVSQIKDFETLPPSEEARLLHTAIRFRRHVIVMKLLKKGICPDSSIEKNYTALHAAVFCNDQITVNLLLSNGADINAVTEDGQSAAKLALVSGNLELLFLLLNNGAKITADDDFMFTILLLMDEKLLHKLVRKKILHFDKELLKQKIETESNPLLHYFLEQNPQLIKRTDEDGVSLLSTAILSKRNDVIVKLCDMGVDLNVHDKFGNTTTCLAKEFSVLNQLKKLGADIFKTEGLNSAKMRFAILGDLKSQNDTLVPSESDDVQVSKSWNFLAATDAISCILKEIKAENEADEEFLKVYSDAFENTRFENDEEKAKKIREGTGPVIIHAGCIIHSRYILFLNSYFVICDRINGGGHPFLTVYKCNNSLMTKEIIRKLALLESSYLERYNYVHVELPKILECEKDAVSSTVMDFIEKRKIFKGQKRGNCTVSNAWPLLFIGRVLENTLKVQEQELEEHYKDFKVLKKDCRSIVESKTKRAA